MRVAPALCYSSTRRHEDWVCPACSSQEFECVNFNWQNYCYQCGILRPPLIALPQEPVKREQDKVHGERSSNKEPSSSTSASTIIQTPWSPSGRSYATVK